MEVINSVFKFFTENWVQLGVALWLLEQAFRILSKITPWKWDDNLVDIVAKVLSALFPPKK